MEKIEQIFSFKEVFANIQPCNAFIEVMNDFFSKSYKELVTRMDVAEKTERRISKLIFAGYMGLPLVISDRIFKLFATNESEELSKKDFVKGMKRLYFGSFESLSQMTFDFFDIADKKVIFEENVQLLLSYFNNNCSNSSLPDIDIFVSEFFAKRPFLTFENYIEEIERNNSNIFLLLLIFLYQEQPYTETDLEFYKEHKVIGSESAHVGKKDPDLDTSKPSNDKICFPSPKIRKIFKNDYQFQTNAKRKNGSKNVLSFKDLQPNTEKESFSLDSANISNSSKNFNSSINNSSADFNFEFSSDSKKTKFLKSSSPKRASLFKKEKESDGVKENAYTIPSIEIDLQTPLENLKKMDQTVFKLSKEGTLKKYKINFIGKILFSFRFSKSKKQFILNNIHSLSGYYLTSIEETEIEGKTMFPVSLLNQYGNTLVNINNIFFFLNKNEMEDFVNQVQKEMKCNKITDTYEIFDEELGRGHFGKVKLGKNMHTQEKVAIKIMQKSQMKPAEVNLIRSEIDMMKFLKFTSHINIVKAFDVFEDKYCIYLVMEYMPGGTLQSYLNKSDNLLSDSQVKSISKQLASGLQFLDKIGILHRDIKPANILISVKSSNITVKIADFGLSKVMGMNEKTGEGFGTLVYSAPELLLNKKYDRKIDIWSFGVVVFYLSYGFLPFNGKHISFEGITKKIICDSIAFNEISTRKLNADHISLIKGCLKKSPDERYDIDKVMSCKWFK